MCNWWLLELSGTLLLENHSLLLWLLRQVDMGTGYQNYQDHYQYTGDYQRLLEITGENWRLLEITGDHRRLHGTLLLEAHSMLLWLLRQVEVGTPDTRIIDTNTNTILMFPYKFHTILSFASYHCVGRIWSSYLIQDVQSSDQIWRSSGPEPQGPESL